MWYKEGYDIDDEDIEHLNTQRENNMSEIIQGLVDSITINPGAGWTRTDITVAGQKYASFDAVDGIAQGDHVKFTAVSKPSKCGQYTNWTVKGGVHKVAGQAAPAPQQAAPQQAPRVTVSNDERQNMIVRQNALTNAVGYCDADVHAPEEIIEVAKVFFHWTSGRQDVEDAKKKTAANDAVHKEINTPTAPDFDDSIPF